MTLRLRLAFLFAAVLFILSGLFVISAQGHLLRQYRAVPGAVDDGASHLAEQEIQDLIKNITGLWLVAGVPIVGLSFLLGFLLASRSVSHLREINTDLAQLRPADLQRGIKSPDRDPELQHLVNNINGLLARIGKSYAELSEFAASVAHELRTPLTLLRMRVDEAAASLPPDFSEDLQEEIQRMKSLVERTLMMSRAEGGLLTLQNAPIDLSSLLERLHEDYSALAQTKGIALTWQAAPGLTVTGDADTVRQILYNLLNNALRYTGHKVDLQASNGRGRVRIEITNDLAPAGKTTRGTGIGLRLTTSLTRAMPGWEFDTEQSNGTYRAVVVAPAA